MFRKLAQQKESRIEEGHLMPDHVHMMISIPPKCAVSQVIGFIKGKSAIHLARVYGEKKRNFVGQHFWARGYFVSTVGRMGKAPTKNAHVETMTEADFLLPTLAGKLAQLQAEVEDGRGFALVKGVPSMA